MVTKTCQDCGKQFECDPIVYGGREIFPIRACQPCVEAREVVASDRDAAEQKAMHKAAWEEICPALYRDTDVSRLPEPFRALVSGWKFSPKGLGMTGEAGKCKTRCAFLILKGQHDAGKRVYAASATKLSQWCQNQFSDEPRRKSEAVEKLQEMRDAKVLLIDDLGKSKMTERVEQEFFDILEHRTSNLLPTIWTANASAKELRAMLGGDRGDPIMRRLKEFSEIVSA